MPRTTAYFSDGRHVDVPATDVLDWQFEVQNLDTTHGLADWFTDQGEERQEEIEGTAVDETRCDHKKHSHIVTNESQINSNTPVADAPHMSVRVCHRRACILDAMAWVERGTGESAGWRGPHGDFAFDVPKEIPTPITETTPQNSGARLSAIMADHDRGPEYALVQCAGEEGRCSRETRIEDSKNLSDEDITSVLAEKGWTVKPTRCPDHNLTKGQTPLLKG